MRINLLVLITILVIGIIFNLNLVFAEEYVVTIPFGAHDPTFETPVENWYEPPIISIKTGDSVTWKNIDREGHTVTSGEGTGRFGWMGGEEFGKPNGLFDSKRFLPDKSWSHTFNNEGIFRYYCTIHPWMEGAIVVGQSIPDYPHDSNGKKIDSFPVVAYTQDQVVEIDLTWEPDVLLTHEEVIFIYHTYDPQTNSNIDKMGYDFIILQNGEEIFRDDGITGVGGDYRNFIFEKAGPIDIIFENISSWGTSGLESSTRSEPSDISLRSLKFSAMVYDNPTKTEHHGIVIQPAKRVELQYELLLAIILIPGALAIAAVLYMMYGKDKRTRFEAKSAID